MAERGERLQKVLARAGYGSRRALETWISDGRVSINGEIAELGQRVTRSDRIVVDGRSAKSDRLFPDSNRTIGYHKPVGEICTRHDPQGRPTIFDRLPSLTGSRWISVGRLDINSCGLIIMTTDGELAQRLMHPAQQVPREYAVRVRGEATAEQLQRLREGVELDDGAANFNDIVQVGGKGLNQWYHVVLMEGRQREVRRLWESQGLVVNRLIRVRYGTVRLPRDQPAGRWWALSAQELDDLWWLADGSPR